MTDQPPLFDYEPLPEIRAFDSSRLNLIQSPLFEWRWDYDENRNLVMRFPTPKEENIA